MEEGDLLSEMDEFEWDDKYFDTRRQRVLNKRARKNVCFGMRKVVACRLGGDMQLHFQLVHLH